MDLLIHYILPVKIVLPLAEKKQLISPCVAAYNFFKIPEGVSSDKD